MNFRFIFLLMLAVASNLYAEDESKKIAFEAELGVISTSGNTETTSAKSKLDLKRDGDNWRNHFVLEGLYKQDQVEVEVDGETTLENRTTAQKYFLSSQADYKLDTEHKGLFIFASYQDDRFSGYNYQATLAAGYSNRLFEFEHSFLDYSIGPGISFSETTEYVDEDDVLVESEQTQTGVLRIAAAYELQLSGHAKFTQTVSSDIALEGGENSKSKSETALTANLTASFALKAAFVVSHNTHVPDEKKHADTQTALTLVYSY